jgi:hypothetical protein
MDWLVAPPVKPVLFFIGANQCSVSLCAKRVLTAKSINTKDNRNLFIWYGL